MTRRFSEAEKAEIWDSIEVVSRCEASQATRPCSRLDPDVHGGQAGRRPDHREARICV